MCMPHSTLRKWLPDSRTARRGEELLLKEFHQDLVVDMLEVVEGCLGLDQMLDGEVEGILCTMNQGTGHFHLLQ